MGKAQIAEAITSARTYLAAHPDEARYRDSTATAVVEDGLRIRVTGPDGSSVVTDMVTGVGGSGSAPSPGWLFRAAYSSCVATLITMRAAEQGIELTGLEVEVDSESDDRGILGIAEEVPAGPASMRVTVRVGPGVKGAARDIVEWGLRHCPVDDAIRRAIPVKLEIRTS
ncbi:OsmC family protein [Pseudarthrobacter sp. NamB4]|uniref:OsmC family protein n=1 Tax=Pseudarthrobacter sp. NamB4 TaxID=2576837 RepID=UPI0010FE6542|nr:OsmC family protein [Pseudarthrobacter sp. NamB4]TLM72266.1 OsmC family protein [Pseudarthrobacter sp. NamB4]